MDAEKLLLEKPKGSYLMRVSEKVWGYTISYRAVDRCKHFLIDASEDQYHFFGPNQLPHDSILDLVNYHKVSNMSHCMTKPTKSSVHPWKTQIRLGGSQSSMCAQWVAKDPWFLRADSEDSD